MWVGCRLLVALIALTDWGMRVGPQLQQAHRCYRLVNAPIGGGSPA